MDRRSFVKNLLGGTAATLVPFKVLPSILPESKVPESKVPESKVPGLLKATVGPFPPSDPTPGTVYLDIYLEQVYIYDGSKWRVITDQRFAQQVADA